MRITADGMVYVMDLTVIITEKSYHEAAKVLLRLFEEQHLSIKFIERDTGGSGNTRTKLVSLNDSLELINVLPGKMDLDTRKRFADAIRRHYEGGDTPVDEPPPSLASEPAPSVDRVLETRKRQLELEDMELQFRARKEDMELQFKARRESMETESLIRRAEAKAKELANVTTFRTELGLIKTDNTIDSATRYAMEYALKQAFYKDAQVPPLTPPIDTPAAIEKAAASTTEGVITVSAVAVEMGKGKPGERTAMAIGATLANLYRNRHGVSAPTVVRPVFGNAVRVVKLYTERDRDLMEEAIREHMG